MATHLSQILGRLSGAEQLTDDDVLALRRAVYEDGAISISEADGLFELSDSVRVKPESFGEFFMEAVTDFLVRQTLPYGYVDDANATWLITRISKDGLVETMTELRLLVNVLKTATDSTDRLVGFALSQIKHAVLEGSGVIGRGRNLEAGKITQVDVELLRNIIYACGGDRHIAVSRTEAEVLFDLNDATRGADNAPQWQDLFVKGIANYLMFLSTYQTADRDEALRRERWMESRGDLGLGSMLRKLKFKDVIAEFTGSAAKEEAAHNARLTEAQNAAVRRAENIDPEEAAWLSSRIGRDGDYDENEKALMAFLEAESPFLHISLKPLLGAA